LTFAALLADLVPRLERAKLPYMVTGALASTFYGEPRATRDLDIVIDPDRPGLARLVDELRSGGYYVDGEAALEALTGRRQFNAIADEGLKIDFIIRKDRPFSVEEFGRRVRVHLLGSQAFVATPEDVVIAKLEWAAETDSDRQRRDVAGIVGVADNLDIAYIEQWATRLGVDEAWHAIVETPP